MLKNLIQVAFRNFKKDKWYSLLNILGLTIGMTFSLFLIFYIRDELTFDRFNINADRIYRINSYIQEKDKNTNWAITQYPLAQAMQREFPEVEQAVRFNGRERTLFKQGNHEFYETKVYYADSNVFNVFTARFLEGNPAKALYEPYSIVISRTLADKYFGRNTPAFGKTLRTVYDLYKVTGVIEDLPRNTHFRYDMLISMNSIKNQNNGGQNWGNFGYFTYVLLKPNANPAAVTKKLVQTCKKYVEPIFSQFNIKMY